jgi:hypothetical protein
MQGLVGQQVSAPQPGSKPHDGSIAQPGVKAEQPGSTGAAQPGSA